MKLCITAAGKELEARVDARFGRAPWFLIVDTDTGTFEAVENTAANQGQGAGISAAQLVTDKSVDAILTGRVGPNSMSVLQKTNIKLFEGVSSQDTVSQALVKFKNGTYSETSSAAGASPRMQGGGGRGMGRGMGGGGGQGMGGGGRRRR